MGLLDYFFQKPVEERAVYNTTQQVVDGAFSLDSLLSTTAINEDKVMKIPTAKACVDLITTSVAKMPVYLYKELPDGSIERVTDRRIKLLNHEANDFLTGYNLKKFMAKDYLLHGASYTSIIEAGNTILELHPLPAPAVVIQKRIQQGFRVVGADIMVSSSDTGSVNSKPVTFKPYEVMIALQESYDGLTSQGAIKQGQEIFAQALSEMEYTSNLYENGALPLGLLKTAGRMNQNQANDLRNAWKNLYGGTKNAAKTVVLQEGMEYEALSMNPTQIQMNETKKSTSSEICKLFNVPESMISTAANKYGSIEQNNLHFLKYTLAPVLTAMESAMDKSLLLESEKEAGYFFRFDTTELTRATQKETVDALVAAVSGGILTINEARASLDKPAIAEDVLKLTIGDVLMNPDTGETQVPNTDGGSTDGQQTDGNQNA